MGDEFLINVETCLLFCLGGKKALGHSPSSFRKRFCFDRVTI